jgi:ATP-dependent Clp protease ATP-binding subunit ClpB
MEQHSVARMLGSPPGYIGHDEGGQLTEAVRKRPYSVVLLDEIEKAHPQVLNALLQVLDDGRLTDGKGRTVNFTNTIIIMTSNMGSEYLGAESVDEKTGTLKAAAVAAVDKVVKQFLRPEFINRLDEIILFKPLTSSQLHSVTRILLDDLAKRLKDKEMSLQVDSSAIDVIIQNSPTLQFGARPLKRYIEHQIVTNISKLIISGQAQQHSIIRVSGNAGRIQIDVMPGNKPHTRNAVERSSASASSSSNANSSSSSALESDMLDGSDRMQEEKATHNDEKMNDSSAVKPERKRAKKV